MNIVQWLAIFALLFGMGAMSFVMYVQSFPKRGKRIDYKGDLHGEPVFVETKKTNRFKLSKDKTYWKVLWPLFNNRRAKIPSPSIFNQDGTVTYVEDSNGSIRWVETTWTWDPKASPEPGTDPTKDNGHASFVRKIFKLVPEEYLQWGFINDKAVRERTQDKTIFGLTHEQAAMLFTTAACMIMVIVAIWFSYRIAANGLKSAGIVQETGNSVVKAIENLAGGSRGPPPQ